MNEDILREVKLQLHAAYPLALTANRIHRDAKKAGYPITLQDVKAALQFLTDDGVAQSSTVPGGLDPNFRLTADGVRHCKELFA